MPAFWIGLFVLLLEGLRSLHRMGLEVFQSVQSVDVSLGAGRDDVRVGAATQGHETVFPQADGHFALGIGAAGQGADREPQQFGLASVNCAMVL